MPTIISPKVIGEPQPTKPVKCLWKAVGYKPIVHRIIWWMLDVGAPGNILQHGWQVAAAKEIGMHRITLHRQVEIMVDAGILFEGEKKGEVVLNTAIFGKKAKRDAVRMMPWNGRKF